MSLQNPLHHRLSTASTLRIGSTRSTYQAHKKGPTLGDLLVARPSGIVEQETWAILCQSVQALQDLFLSDGASGTACVPLITPSTLILSSKGRVKLCQLSGPSAHMTGYLAPEYRVNKNYSDTEFEKMWIFGLGETLKRATLTSHVATSRISTDLCQVLTDMTKVPPVNRASLMHLLDVISAYCKKRHQNRPFSHIVMDLHQEATASLEDTMDTWGPPAMPELMPRTRNRSESTTDSTGFSTLPRRWMGLSKTQSVLPKMTREASTSMEDLYTFKVLNNAPGKVIRPKSMCVPNDRYFHVQNGKANTHRIYSQPDNNNFYQDVIINDHPVHSLIPKSNGGISNININTRNNLNVMSNEDEETDQNRPVNKGPGYRRLKVRRNPIQRSASRLYRTGLDKPVPNQNGLKNCIGPEFVVRAALPTKKLAMNDCKGTKKSVTVILLDGQKVDVLCSPSTTTAGELFELIIQEEHIEENFMLGLSTLIAGDFVFLPSDTRICKVMQPDNNPGVNLTLFLRVRFFLPSLRGIRGSQARHLLYLQLRRSILEHQLPCSFSQVVELNGLALQAEFGNFSESKHGTREYFLLDHYVPETMISVIDDQKRLREELTKAHVSKIGLEREKAEQDFISFTQNLPHYGGHFYTATWILKDSKETKDIWLYISAQGINLYERGKTTSHFGPQLYEMFEWKSIQTLCYSKHYLCILPHTGVKHRSKLKKYKLKMDHKKSYFAFRLASLHHQFFLRLRTEFTSLQSLSQQFGVPLKDIKNETNSLYKLDALTRPLCTETEYGQYGGSMSAETEFKIEFRTSSRSSRGRKIEELRSKSDENLFALEHKSTNEENQNKENERPTSKYRESGALILDSSCFAGLPNTGAVGGEKRRGVKMGTRAISSTQCRRVSRSMEAVNIQENDYLEQMSLQSVSLHCSSASISKPSSVSEDCAEEAYILDSTLKSYPNQLLPNFHESLNDTLIEKLDTMSFAEERYLSSVQIEKNTNHSLGLKITEGSDGHVYVQSVIINGPAYKSGKINRGDQIIAVDNHCLLGINYNEALDILKSTGRKVEFILSRTTANLSSQLKSKKNLSDITEDDAKNITLTSERVKSLHDSIKSSLELDRTLVERPILSSQSTNRTSNTDLISNEYKYIQNLEAVTLESPIEKYLTESCHDSSNNAKYKVSNEPDLIDFRSENCETIASHFKSKTYKNDNDRAVIVDLIPKRNVEVWKYEPFSFESNFANNLAYELNEAHETKNELINTLETSHKSSGNIDEILFPCEKENYAKNAVAMPRTMGLSRKWRGPVRYPVTPVKKTGGEADTQNQNKMLIESTSDEDQIFI